MNALVGRFLTVPMEAILSSCPNSHCGSQISAVKANFTVTRKQLQKECSMLGNLSAGERAGPCFGAVRVSPMEADDEWNGQAGAAFEQVAEPQERWGRILTRRSLLALHLAAVALPVSPSWAAVKVENRAPFGTSLLRTFGIGDPDIFYPWFFEGTWNCYSTLIAVETPQGEGKVDLKSVESSRKRLGYTVIRLHRSHGYELQGAKLENVPPGGSKQTTYQARFVPFKGFVVCDRLFTTVSLVESIIGKDTVQNGTWSPQQPNRLELVIKGGAKVENTVTKRSAGMFSDYEFESAEFSKEVLDNFSLQGGPPTVKASQNLTRYQWDSTAKEVSKIEAVQKVSMYAVPKEGLDFEGMEMFNSTSPVTIYKYRVTFERS